MIPLMRLKREVQFNTELTQIVDALKGIAAARFHLLERQVAFFDAYFKATEKLLSGIPLGQIQHPFVQPPNTKVGVLMVTSTAGFLGGLNMRVLAAGLSECGSDGMLTVIGERGASALRDQRQGFSTFPGIEDTSRFKLALEVRDHLVRQVLSGQCGKLVAVFPKPLSFSVQQVTVQTLLPCTEWLSPELQKGVSPNLLWESSPRDLLEYVLSQWIAHRLAEIFAHSRLAELAARVIHLEGSYQELLGRGRRMKMIYFRARHEVIDRSMREIYASQLMFGKESADETDA